MLMHHRHVPVPVCTISILLVFHTNSYQFSETTSGNNRVTVPVKPQETTNYELHGTGRATRAPVAQTLQSVRQTCPRTTATCPYPFARFPSCWFFTPTRTSSVKQRVETTGGAGETSRTDKLRVAWHGLGNTRARRTNTAKRAPNMPMPHRHVLVPV
jgi:hypothetical protein